MANSLGDQLVAVLKADGSAPAIALMQHIIAANGNVAEDEKAVAEFLADDTALAPELVGDLSRVLFGWLLQRVVHWVGSQGAPSALTQAPGPVVAPATTAAR